MLPLSTFRMSLSLSTMSVPSAFTLLSAARSNSSGPNRLAKAICWSRPRCCPGEDEECVLQPGSVEIAPRRVVKCGKLDAPHHCAEGGVERFDVKYAYQAGP